MSSIGGVSNTISTNTTSTTSVTSTTSTTSTVTAFYLDLGLGDLPVDLTGLTMPRTPADTAALLEEILATADDLNSKMKEDRIRAAGDSARSALAIVAAAVAEMLATSQKVLNDQNRIDDLTKQRQTAVDGKAVQQQVYDTENRNFTNADNRVNTAYNGYEGQRAFFQGQIDGYNRELADSGTSKDRKKQISDPGGLMDQAVNARDTAIRNRDAVKTNANPDWVERNRALGARDEASAKIADYDKQIKQIDEVDMPAAKAQKVTDQNTVNAINQVVLAIFSIFAMLTAGKVSEMPKSDSRSDDFLTEFTDKMTAIAQKAADLMDTDWSGATADSTNSSDSTAPRNKIVAVASSLVMAIREIVDALAGLTDLSSTNAPGLEAQNGRFRI